MGLRLPPRAPSCRPGIPLDTLTAGFCLLRHGETVSSPNIVFYFFILYCFSFSHSYSTVKHSFPRKPYPFNLFIMKFFDCSKALKTLYSIKNQLSYIIKGCIVKKKRGIQISLYCCSIRKSEHPLREFPLHIHPIGMVIL